MSKGVEQQGKKTSRLALRLSAEEMEIFRTKAKKYVSISSMVIDAVSNHDERRGRGKIDLMIQFSELAVKLDRDLCRIGNNINQIARELHRYNNSGMIPSGFIIESFTMDVLETKSLLELILRELRSLTSTRR